ncbi:MAG: MGMT family protein [Candidatus Moranbacteria bacterium]|nr:MGMT family protein [Candidatus Moranbacteria bacterium]
MKKQPVSPFAVAVQRVVRAIPRGQVMSYQEVAVEAGFSGASRAVGTLMKKNFDPGIPCHRVICSDGRVGAYNRGVLNKVARLRAEGVIVSGKRVRYPV